MIFLIEGISEVPPANALTVMSRPRISTVPKSTKAVASWLRNFRASPTLTVPAAKSSMSEANSRKLAS